VSTKDRDGLTDATEKEDLHTDPESEVTYIITTDHQKKLVDELVDSGEYTTAAQTARNSGVPTLTTTD